MSLQLYRENVHVEPRPIRDVWEAVQLATCLFLYCVIGWLVMNL